MKFDLQFESEQDIEYFKTLFYRNIGVEQNVFDFIFGDVKVSFQVSAIEGGQSISVGFFSITKEGNSTSINQFCPLSDSRYGNYRAIQDIWGMNPFQVWAVFTHGADCPDNAFETLKEILYTVYTVNKLRVSA